MFSNRVTRTKINEVVPERKALMLDINRTSSVHLWLTDTCTLVKIQLSYLYKRTQHLLFSRRWSDHGLLYLIMVTNAPNHGVLLTTLPEKKKSWAHLKGVPTFPEYWDDYLNKVCTWSNSVSLSLYLFPLTRRHDTCFHLCCSSKLLCSLPEWCPIIQEHSFLHSPESSTWLPA